LNKHPIFPHSPTRVFALLLALFAAFGWLSFSHAKYPSYPSTRETFIPWFAEKVAKVNAKILTERDWLLTVYDDWLDSGDVSFTDWKKLAVLAKAYQVPLSEPVTEQEWYLLMFRVDIVPVSLVVAQAGNESAWGQSRFAREANNYFGQWCFRPGCGIVPKKRPAGKRYEVAKFSTPEASIESYERNLNTNAAYRPFRALRSTVRKTDKPLTGSAVVSSIANYNPSRGKYTRLIAQIIRKFDLEKYDL